VTDERFGFPPTGREGPGGATEGTGPRRVPIYDRRTIRPEDLAQPAQRPDREREQQEEPRGPAPAETAAAGEAPEEAGRGPGAAADLSGSSGPSGPSGSVEDVKDVEEIRLDGGGDAGLQEELRLANEKATEHLGDLQRLQAEFANYRKRVLREQTELMERASGHLVRRLLSVLDSFELATAAAEETKDFERMLRGVEMVLGELKEVLAAEGLETIPAKDLPFDPNLHEAALEVPGDEDGEMVVAGVLRPGYVLKGRILRPAMVKVTRRAAGQARASAPDRGETVEQ
jgi:molecular chaperone GrpE